MKISVTLLLILATRITLIAQNPFVKETKYNQHILIQDGAIASPNASPLLKILASGNGKSLRSTSFALDFEQLLRINTREPSVVYVIDNSAFHLSGDINYRGFDVSDQLVPADLSYIIHFSGRSGATKDFKFTATITNGKPENNSLNYTDTTGVMLNYTIMNLIVHYNESVQQNFLNRTNLIDDYYSSIHAADIAYAQLLTINPDDVDNFQFQQQKLTNAQLEYDKTQAKQFASHLPLPVNDPGRLLEKLSIYNNLLIQKRNGIATTYSTLHIIFYNRGVERLQHNDISLAQTYFQQALEVNPSFAPALLQLAIINYRRGELHESICKTDDLLYNLNPDPETKHEAYNLLSDISKAHLQLGLEEADHKNYRKALDEYENAKRICEKYVTIHCTDELFNAIRSAKRGIYSDFLTDARTNLEYNHLDAAESSVEGAFRYQKINKAELPDANEAIEVNRSIQQKRYDQSINNARNLTDQKMFDAALREFRDADSLKQTFHLTELKDVSKLILLAAKPRINELLYEGDAYVKNEDLSAARDRIKLANDIQLRYGLNTDKEINKHTEKLRKSIYTLQCLNAQDEMDKLYVHAQTLVAQNDYLMADSEYEKAISIAETNKDCDLSTDSIVADKNKIRAAVSYLKLMRQSLEADKAGDYRKCLETYNKAGIYFYEMNVDKFGIIHENDPYNYVRDKGSNGLVNYTADTYTETNHLEQALLLYKLLLSRNYDHKIIDGSLYKLGFKLGQKDKLAHPDGNRKELIKLYSDGDKKLKRFHKGYKRGFKQS